MSCKGNKESYFVMADRSLKQNGSLLLLDITIIGGSSSSTTKP